MTTQHLVVDGSNIATEGRSTPSLAQLESAVAEVHREFPDAEVTVVVDATFAHRIDPSELERFEQAALRGEYVYPPAGAIGRGDAFLLRIAERVDGIALSNDSFQEFHGEHGWLFDRGRLLGATPVPGVGWIFVPRTPVRGPRSRVAVREASRAKQRVVKAIAQATKEVVEPEADTGARERTRRSRARGHGQQAPQAVNDPMTFISFIAEHPLGDEIEGTVDSFSSHGAVVLFGDVRCYVPLSGLGSPAPRAAREVLHRGEVRAFAVTALDPFRRGVELALPEIAVISGRPSEETVAAEMRMSRAQRKTAAPAEGGAAPGARRRAAARGPVTRPADDGPAKKQAAKKQTAPVRGAKAEQAAQPVRKAPAKTQVAPALPAKTQAPKKQPAATQPAAEQPAKTQAPKKQPVKKQPAATRPAAEQVAQTQPAAKQPARMQPATKQPATKQPARKQPATKQPAAKQPAAKQPAAKQPAAKQPATTQPAATRRAAKQPAARQPATTQPAATRRAAKQPAARQVAKKQPAAKQAAARQVAQKQPAAKQPASKHPASKQGGTAQPARRRAAAAQVTAQRATNPPVAARPPATGEPRRRPAR